MGRIALSVLLALVIAGAAGVTMLTSQTQHLLSTFSRARDQNVALTKARHEVQGRLDTLDEEYTKLMAANRELTMDRDNLLIQLKRIREGQERAAGEQQVLQQAVKNTLQENRRLKGALAPVQLEQAQLKSAHGAVVAERDKLQAELDRVQKRQKGPDETARLKEALAQERQARAKEQGARENTKAALQQAQQMLKTAGSSREDAEERAAKSLARFAALQERYTNILSENATLNFQLKKFPKDVTGLAQQHQRLIKETADMHYNLGVLFTENKQYGQAAGEFRKVIEVRPDDADAHYNLGVIYAEHLPDQAKAVEHFRRYLQLNPRAGDANWVKKYIVSWQAWEAKERLE